MTWKLDSDRPIYAQLVEDIQMRIVSGAYPPGSRLPSVRELSSEAGVNPNTMQRAFSELERNGLLETRRTSGRFVTEDEALIHSIRRELAEEQLAEFFRKMKRLGYRKQEALALISAAYEEELSQ